MRPLDMGVVEHFIADNIDKDFFDKKLSKLTKITLSDIVKRKNPYLFKAKRIETGSEFIRQVLDATVSSGEETIFGDFMERVALLVCSEVYGGQKSTSNGIDLDFSVDTIRYLVSIKSGPNWGNAGQIKAMKSNFIAARRTLGTSGGERNRQIICIEGCCYGIDNKPDKTTHLKLCGQRFWEFISGGHETLYRDLLEPLGRSVEEKSLELRTLHAAKQDTLTAEFVLLYCDNEIINWDRLAVANSGKTG